MIGKFTQLKFRIIKAVALRKICDRVPEKPGVKEIVV
jgi:hypothetical protein